MAVTEINILRGIVEPYTTDFVAGNDPVNVADQVIDFSSWDQMTAGTDEGAKLNLNFEWQETIVQEHRAAIEAQLIREGGTVTFDTKESDLLTISETLAPSTYTVAAAAGTNPNVLGGGDKAIVATQSLAFSGDGPAPAAGVGQVWYFPKVRLDSIEEIAFNKLGDVMFRYTWVLLMDAARSAGERMYKVFEITSA